MLCLFKAAREGPPARRGAGLRKPSVIDKLEFLITVASEKSFSRAAELCGVTQPTLSAGIKQLEDSLGVLLVNRSSRFHGLTAEGERVLEWAKRIVGDARAMRQEVRTLREGLSGQLKIAVIPTAEGIVSAITTPYREKHPHVRFKVVSASSTEVLAMLDNLEIDAGITYLDNEPLGRVRTVPLCSERYRLLTTEGNPLGDRERVTWAEVGRIELCLLTPDMQNRRIVERLIGAGGRRTRADPRIELGHSAFRPCEIRPLGDDPAGKTRKNMGNRIAPALHSDRRAGGRLRNRPRRAAARPGDSAGWRARCRGKVAG
jgi:DNA-binding transcriptional LysR family regulator